MLLAACVLTGCAQPTPVGPAAPVPLIDESGLNQLLAQSAGKVLLVDFWATWCQPCRALFPHTVALQRELADRGLVVITVALDDSDQTGEVQDFLRAQGARSYDFMSRYGNGSESAAKFDIDGGAIPHVRLYDRRGRLREKFGYGNPPDPSRIDEAVKALLAEN